MTKFQEKQCKNMLEMVGSLGRVPNPGRVMNSRSFHGGSWVEIYYWRKGDVEISLIISYSHGTSSQHDMVKYALEIK